MDSYLSKVNKQLQRAKSNKGHRETPEQGSIAFPEELGVVRVSPGDTHTQTHRHTDTHTHTHTHTQTHTHIIILLQ